MQNILIESQANNVPPSGISRPLQALWWLKKGGFQLNNDWETAHEICQSAEGDIAHDWVHGLAHWIEGDIGNADYWYRRVGKKRSGATIAAEWEAIVAELSD